MAQIFHALFWLSLSIISIWDRFREKGTSAYIINAEAISYMFTLLDFTTTKYANGAPFLDTQYYHCFDDLYMCLPSDTLSILLKE